MRRLGSRVSLIVNKDPIYSSLTESCLLTFKIIWGFNAVVAEWISNLSTLHQSSVT
jgi:hypothetical protein